MAKIDWAQIKLKLREDIVVLPHFFKNPIHGMRNLPPWEWPTILVLQGAFAVICSVIANSIEREWVGLITGIIIAPVTNYIVAGVAAGFFYYYFMFILKRDFSYRQIYLNIIFAAIPLMAVTMIAFLVPPIILVGMAAALLLLYVGFVDSVQLPKKHLRNLLMVIFAVNVVYWGFQQLNSPHKHKSMHEKATPESLDILEKELNNE
jgi:hypothetical protein